MCLSPLTNAWAGNSTVITNPYTAANGDVVDATDYNNVNNTIIGELSNIGRANIIQSGVASDEIQDGTVGASDLDTNAVTNVKMEDDSVGSSEVINASLTADDLANNAVATSEILDDAVTKAKIAADQVEASEIAAGAVGTSELADGSVAWADINPLIDTLNYNYSKLKIDAYTSATSLVVTADHMTLINPDTGALIVIKSVSETISPSNATAALNGQLTNFSAGNNTDYYVWVAAKSDGTSPVACVANSAVIGTVQDNFITLDSTYTFVGLYGTVRNMAGGSWSLRNSLQIGAKVKLMESEVVFTQTSTNTNASDALSDEFPTGICSMADFTFEIDSNTSAGSTEFKLFGESGAGILIEARPYNDGTTPQKQCVTAIDHPVPGGSIFYSVSVAGTSSVRCRLNGYTIDHLAR